MACSALQSQEAVRRKNKSGGEYTPKLEALCRIILELI